jgi:hypothetical protein
MNPGNFELSNEQWNFVFKHYPEHGGAPYEIMIWLFAQSRAHEEMYMKPSEGGM